MEPAPADIPLPRLIAARVLARTCSPRRAARKSGLALAEVKSLQKDPIFAQLVLENRTASVMRTVAAIIKAGPLAVQALADELGKEPRKTRAKTGPKPKDEKFAKNKPLVNSNELDPRRIRAAKMILELLPKYIEIGEIVPRLRKVEETIAESQGPAQLPAHEPDDPNIINADVEVVQRVTE